MFDQPDHIVAKIAEQSCRNSGQIGGHIDTAFGNQRAHGIKRVAVQWLKCTSLEPGGTVDTGLRAVALPDQIRFQADHRIAAPHFAAGDGFQHEGIGARVAEFKHQ